MVSYNNSPDINIICNFTLETLQINGDVFSVYAIDRIIDDVPYHPEAASLNVKLVIILTYK